MSGHPPESRISIVACTLYSGHYHFGVGALANSLHRSGFRGTMCVGYRPPLPPWAMSTRRDGDTDLFEAAPDFHIRFVPWPGQRNLSLEKANFGLHVLDQVEREAEALLLFDADVVVKASQRFFRTWLDQGVGLCLDLTYPFVPAGHPWRKGWRELAAQRERQCRDLDYYVNSGFVGVSRAHREVIEAWAQLIDDHQTIKATAPDQVKFASREEPFVGDQDMLNAALMATSVPLSIMGQEAMDFAPAGFVMSHAVDADKPWQKRYFRAALAGRPPGAADKAYWQVAGEPIPVFPQGRILRTRAALRAAGLIGRFYARRRDAG